MVDQRGMPIPPGAVTRCAEPCRRCGGPVYKVRGNAPQCAGCGWQWGVDVPVVTPAAGRWHRGAWQAVAVLIAATVVLALASLGLALPPRVMLAVGIAGGLCVAIAGVWIMAGAIYDDRRQP